MLSRRAGALGVAMDGHVEQVKMAETRVRLLVSRSSLVDVELSLPYGLQSSSEVLIHPQSRNLHGQAFGGQSCPEHVDQRARG